MAVKHIIANGIGFEPVSYVVTDGIGDYAAATGPDPVVPAWWRAEYVRQLQKRRAARSMIIHGRLAATAGELQMSVDNSIPESEAAFITGL